jgi:hypothetical protein
MIKQPITSGSANLGDQMPPRADRLGDAFEHLAEIAAGF